MGCRILLLTVFCLSAFATMSHAQKAQKSAPKVVAEKSLIDVDSVAFCKSMIAIIADAPGNFERAKGNIIETNGTATIYSVNRGLPGAATSNVVFERSWRFEGVVYQGRSVPALNTVYETYSALLDRCLAGYTTAITTNPAKGLEAFATVTYTPADKGAPEVVLRTETSEINGVYTVSIVVQNK